MITLKRHPGTVLIQWGLLLLIAGQALLSTPASDNRWWLIAGLSLLYAILIYFWPVKRALIYIYLAVELALLLSLTALNTNFLFMGFVFSPHAAILLPLRQMLFAIGGFSLVLITLLNMKTGWEESLFSSVAPILGFFSFGYAYYQRERADENQAKTQRLLDELREAHHKLEAYAAQVQELAVVEERNRIARELHDSVKQEAFAASGQIGAARALIESNPAAAQDHLQKAETLIDAIRVELGQLIYQLRPPALQEQGLSKALQTWGQGWSEQARIQLKVSIEGERGLSVETEQALFRITQETLANVARHSHADRAEIRLEYHPKDICLSIRDNGQGFDPAHPGDGVGLNSIRERVERLPDGALEIHSAPRQGTEIVVRCTG